MHARTRTAVTVLAAGAMVAAATLSASAAVIPDTGHTTGGETVEIPLSAQVRFSELTGAESSFAARDQHGSLWTWGADAFDQLLRGDTGGSAAPAPVLSGADADLVQIDFSGAYLALGHAVALTADGSVVAWGGNQYGQSGVDPATAATVATPQSIALPGPAVQVAAGVTANYALLADGSVWGWGGNLEGELGLPERQTNGYIDPVQIDIPATIASIDAGAGVGLAVTDAGELYTWGFNAAGELARPTPLNWDAEPAVVPGLSEVTMITASAASSSTVAAVAGGELYTWGSNALGVAGDGVGAEQTTPFHLDLPGTVSDISLSLATGVAQTTDGQVWAWGTNMMGNLGPQIPVSEEITPPTRMPEMEALDVVEIVAGTATTLARTADGQLYGWGLNDARQLGSLSPETSTDIVPIDLGFTASAVDFGGTPGTGIVTTWPTASVVTPAHATGPVEVTATVVDRNGTTWNQVAVGTYTYRATVSFDPQGGSAVDPMVVDTAGIGTAPIPTLADHTFTGWALDPAGSQPWDPSAPLTDDLTVYATWTDAVVDPTPEPIPEPTPDPIPTPDPTPVPPTQERPYDSEVLAADTVVPAGTVLATTGAAVTPWLATAMVALLSGAGLLVWRNRSRSH